MSSGQSDSVAVGDRFLGPRGMVVTVYALGHKWTAPETSEPMAFVNRNTSRRQQGILVRRLLANYQRLSR